MKVGVFGLGRFGFFWSETLSRVFDVVAYDIRPAVPSPEGVERVSLEELCSLDVLYLCVTIRSVPDALRLVAPLVRPETLVVDACSVKVLPARWMGEILPVENPILASHPMFGPESAKEGLAGLPIMVDSIRGEPSSLPLLLDGFSSLGLEVVRMSCQEHDRQAAYSQALTHFVGRSLHALGLPDTEIATRWYRKLHAVVRQCVRDSNELFEDMQTCNPYAAEMRDRVISSLRDFQQTLSSLEASRKDLFDVPVSGNRSGNGLDE